MDRMNIFSGLGERRSFTLMCQSTQGVASKPAEVLYWTSETTRERHCIVSAPDYTSAEPGVPNEDAKTGEMYR